MQPVLKHSRQRDAILNMLRSRYDHPTAEQLYSDLKEEHWTSAPGDSDLVGLGMEPENLYY